MAQSEKSKSKRQKNNSKQGDKDNSGQKNAQQTGKQAQEQKDQQNQGQKNQDQQKQGVGWPEWVTFGIGLVIVLGFVSLQLYLHWRGQSGPSRILVQPNVLALYQEGSDYYLPVEVTNEGGSTAEDVNVQLTLDSGQGNPETTNFLIKFLAPEEVSRLVVVFKTDPRQGKLTYGVAFKNR